MGKKLDLNYFTGQEADQFNFIKIPITAVLSCTSLASETIIEICLTRYMMHLNAFMGVTLLGLFSGSSTYIIYLYVDNVPFVFDS